jgi:uncharacterized protein (DUF58 family)
VNRVAGALALGAALCVVAAGFGAPSLYVAGVGLLLVALVASVWVPLAARDARVIRKVGRAVIEEQAILPITVSVARAAVPLPGGELRLWPGGRALRIPRAGSQPIGAAVRFPRRGRHRLGPASLVIADPLGLCTRTIMSTADEVLVLPRLEPVRMAEVGGGAAMGAGRLAGSAEEGVGDVDSLRPYRPGTPASRIHWPTVARTRALIERGLTADHDGAPLVVVDPRDPSGDEALDRAVRAAASLCAHLARRGGCALLLPGDRTPTRIDSAPGAFAKAQARLAVLEPGAGGPLPAAVHGAAAVLWVTAAPNGSQALAALRAQLRWLVSPHPHPSWPVWFTVAGCSGQRPAGIATATAPKRSAA